MMHEREKSDSAVVAEKSTNAPNSVSSRRVRCAGPHTVCRAITAKPSNPQSGSRLRESRTSGFVRGAHSNMCPYRDPDQTQKEIPYECSCTTDERR